MSAPTLQRLDLRHGYTLDHRAAVFALLFAITIGGAIWGHTHLVNAGAESVTAGQSTATQAGTGAGLSLVTVLEASALLVAIALYRRFPGWLRPVLKRTLVIAFWAFVIMGTTVLFDSLAGFGVGVLGYFGVQVADQLGLHWLLNDVLALGLAVYAGAAGSVLATPLVLGVGLVGLTIYDHVFANTRPWMGRLANAAIAWKLPAMFIVPKSWRFNWDRLTDDNPNAEVIHFGLGLGDLALPAAFAASVYYTVGWLPALFIVGGVLLACLRLSWRLDNGEGMAGLPSLAAGSIGGYAVGASVVALSGVVG